MNKPLQPPLISDEDIGPLDENGQQIWSPEEEEAVARIMADPDYVRSIEESRAAVARGEWYTTEEVFAELERRRRARRGLA